MSVQIELQNIGKKFQKEWIFRQLTYHFELGKSYAIVGTNGSGKSTLLQILAGFLSPTEGNINFQMAQKEISTENIFRYLSIASPYLELIEEFTLLELVKFQLKFKPLRQNISAKQFIEELYLEPHTHKLIKNFSSGMKQRLKLGLALWADTPILLLDEPCSNLDQKGIDWYLSNIQSNALHRLCVISSNQTYEYSFVHQIIDIQNYK